MTEPSRFTVEMLSANEGDALWIEYGHDPVRRILIDCGRTTAYDQVAKRLDADPELSFELLVLTHVDADHIHGAVRLLQDGRFGPDRVGDIWFNGWRHLNGLHWDPDANRPRTMGARQGEYFAAVIRDRLFPWNRSFDGMPVVIADGEDELPVVHLDGDMTITLLGPTTEKLELMRGRWEDDLDKPSRNPIEPGDWERALDVLRDDRRHAPRVPTLGDGVPDELDIEQLADVPFDPDDSEPNGSSISFLAEHAGTSVLFAGDSHAPQLQESIARLCRMRNVERLDVDALKMSHHGSARNNSYELLEMLNCSRFLVSTNGSGHHHPDPEALARIVSIRDGVEFSFNYRSEETELWDDPALRKEYGYTTRYPADGSGLAVDIARPLGD